jgi:hypothetical protein
LKKSTRTYEWDETCNEAFETLKGILVKVHVLKLADFDKDFEIHSDASNFAIRRVLGMKQNKLTISTSLFSPFA